ncbi:unnamed protein product [Prorocentrum cordatum]|uniref:HNH nuclease domain-containing protein n=1 Tax=Prorocentrum cordatum TaxID=2364126 RepID=A0ABN9TWD2_9DINO|nr:unnamed protein product [Polarella glacialis]
MFLCGVVGRARSSLALPSFVFQVSAVPVARPVSHTPLLHPRCLMVSSFGRVQHRSGNIGVGTLTASGYRVTTVAGRIRRVHRLVAEAFLGPPPTPWHSQINHKDGVKSNNHVANLEYATPSQNVLHSYSTNLDRKTGGWMLARPILGRFVGTNVWTQYPSMVEAARHLDLSSSCISRCCRNLLKQTRGYEFKYALADVLENAPGEEWRQAVHPDTGESLSHWIVSSEGRVKSSRTCVGWGTRCPDQYLRVNVAGSSLSVHRLVARAFIGPPPDPERCEINHIDRDRANNRACNLQWVSRSENVLLSYKTDRIRGPMALGKPVVTKHLITKETAQYPSMLEAARRLNLNYGNVRASCYGRVTSVGTYTIRFVEQQVPDILVGEEWRPWRPSQFDIRR